MAGAEVTHPAQLRTLALVGPEGSGKSSLFNQMAVVANRVEVATWGQLRATTLERDGVVLTTLDTPGQPDFDADVQAALRAVDNVAFVISATAGVDAGTIELWHESARRRIPRCVVVTHLDEELADYDEIVAIGQRVFGPEVVAVHYPVLTDDESLGGFIDIMTMQIHDHSGPQIALRNADPEHVRLLAPARQRVGEALLGGDLDPADIDAIAHEDASRSPAFAGEVVAAIARCDIAPVLVAGTIPTNFGIDELISFFTSSLAPPLAFPRLTVTDLAGEPAPPLATDPDGPLCAQVIATYDSDRNGNLVRVFSGTLRPGAVLRIRTAATLSVVIDFLHDPGAQRQRDSAIAGSLVVARGASNVLPGDTLAEPDHPLRTEPWPVALPLHSMRVSNAPAESLHALLEHDRAVHIDGDVLWCMGEQHAAHLRKYLREQLGDTVDLIPVAEYLRETVAMSASEPASGATFGVHISVRPAPANSGVRLDVKGDNQRFDHFVEQVLGVQLQRGPLGDFPVTDVVITVTPDARPDAWDEAVLADSIHRAFDAALHRADPYLLEPLIEITVRIPRDDVETVTRDIVRRRGEITQRTDEPGGTTLLIAQAPLSELARYPIQLANVCDEAVLCDIHTAGFKALPKYLAARYLSAQFDSSNSRV